MKTGTVYRIYNTFNGKSYVGQTTQPVESYVRHKFNHCERCRRLHNAIQKYGKESFTWETIVICKLDDLDFFERFYIGFYDCINNGYNLESGGNALKTMSNESRARMSDAKKMYYTNNPDAIEKLSASKKKYFENPVNRQKQSARTKKYFANNPDKIPMKRTEVREKHLASMKHTDVKRKQSESRKKYLADNPNENPGCHKQRDKRRGQLTFFDNVDN